MTDPESAGPAAGPVTPRRRRRVAQAAGVVLALAGGAGLTAWALRQAARRSGPQTLPEIAYRIIDGRRLGPEALRGQVVLVNFWATRCGICLAEMPELVALYRDYRPRGLELVAVAMPYDRPDHVLNVVATRSLPFPVALDPMGEAVAAWGGVEGTPLTWLVAPDGRVIRRWLGRPDFARVRRDIERLLPARQG